jgi:hypothetical protein
MCIADESQILREVLSYLSEHHDAEDTLEGIVEWWLLEQRIRRQTATVQEVIAELARRRLVLERRGQDDRVRYRLNRRKSKEVAALLEEVKPETRARRRPRPPR